jgi:hypothetical protein
MDKTSSLSFGKFSEFEFKGCGGNHPSQFSGAFGAFFFRGVRHFLLHFKPGITGIALVFVHGHWLDFLLGNNCSTFNIRIRIVVCQ